MTTGVPHHSELKRRIGAQTNSYQGIIGRVFGESKETIFKETECANRTNYGPDKVPNIERPIRNGKLANQFGGN